MTQPGNRGSGNGGRKAFLMGCLFLGVMSSVALVTGCGNKSGDGAPAGARVVVIKGNPLGNPDSQYEPATIHVFAGQTVLWENKDDQDHTVTPDATYPGWSSGSPQLLPGHQYFHTFTKPGVYDYQCMVHPNMFGEVKVSAPRVRKP